MVFRRLALLGISVALLGSACLLEDKRVGGESLDDDPPAPCGSYCDRAATCLGQDEVQCTRSCLDDVAEGRLCHDAVLSALSCLDMSDCYVDGAPAQECADEQQAWQADCEGP